MCYDFFRINRKEVNSMFCKNCGTQVPDGTKYCPSCGTPTGDNVANTSSSSSQMDAKATSIVAYITGIGFLIAYLAGDKEGAKFHLNQALVFNIFCLACSIPFVGWAWSVFMLVCFIMGLVNASEQNNKELPLIGQIHILDK